MLSLLVLVEFMIYTHKQYGVFKDIIFKHATGTMIVLVYWRWINSDLIGFTYKWRIYKSRNRHNVDATSNDFFYATYKHVPM